MGYTAYGDESADETCQRVLAIAALCGSKDEWNMFGEKWISRTGGLPFHAAECDSDQGPYEHIGHRSNKKLYADLANIIADSKLVGNAVAISLPDYKELLATAIDDEPYYLIFHTVIIKLARRSYLCLPRDRIKFIFDRNHQIEYNAGALYDRIVNGGWSQAEFRRSMEDEIGFASRETIGIQAADLVAREAMKLMDNRYGPIQRPTRLSTQALQSNALIRFRLYDRAWCQDVLRDSKDYQYSKEGYFAWLKEHGLHHSLANKIRYEESQEKA